jgi:uncharacterized lipoprotein YddW (UPF0748 family)
MKSMGSRSTFLLLCIATGAFLSSETARARTTVLAAPSTPATIDRRLPSEIAPYRRFLWVTRFDWRTPEDLERIFYQAAQARFSDVLFQVRGEGTVSFRSDLEPWAWQLSGEEIDRTGRDPGWDPLAKAVEEGRRYGLRVHAYLNVMPGWAQKELAPAASGQLLATHRSWFLTDARGNAMDPRRLNASPTYGFLDPSLPAVRAHLAALAGEVAARYEIDGIHLDYIRYPNEHPQYDSRADPTLAAFKQKHHASPEGKPEAWQRYKRDQITEVARGISESARLARPGVEISAAIIADSDTRQNGALQDVEVWLREGLVDAVVPMAYTDRMDRFDRFCKQFSGEPWTGKVWLGVWAKESRNPRLVPQVRHALQSGFPAVAVFSYGELFPERKVTERVVALFQVFVGG